jgi:hypothetical protein
MIAASTPLNAPLSSRVILPPPPSSAGVPISTIRPGKLLRIAASPAAAASAAPLIRLWPHEWPLGSASGACLRLLLMHFCSGLLMYFLSGVDNFACDLLTRAIKELGLAVQAGAGGIPTAFRSEFGASGAAVAILAEYAINQD